MHTELEAPKRKAKSKSQGLRIGDRVTFTGQVLRVLDGDERPLLIMIEASGTKLVIKSHWFERGEKLKGSDDVTLAGTVTRVGEEAYTDYTPISIQVDGFTSSRVTLASKWLSHE